MTASIFWGGLQAAGTLVPGRRSGTIGVDYSSPSAQAREAVGPRRTSSCRWLSEMFGRKPLCPSSLGRYALLAFVISTTAAAVVSQPGSDQPDFLGEEEPCPRAPQEGMLQLLPHLHLYFRRRRGD